MLQSTLPPHIIVIIFIRLENRHVLFCVKETSFRHLLEQLRAMNEHDETAPAAFRFIYSTLSKHMDAYSSSSLL